MRRTCIPEHADVFGFENRWKMNTYGWFKVLHMIKFLFDPGNIWGIRLFECDIWDQRCKTFCLVYRVVNSGKKLQLRRGHGRRRRPELLFRRLKQSLGFVLKTLCFGERARNLARISSIPDHCVFEFYLNFALILSARVRSFALQFSLFHLNIVIWPCHAWVRIWLCACCKFHSNFIFHIISFYFIQLLKIIKNWKMIRFHSKFFSHVCFNVWFL